MATAVQNVQNGPAVNVGPFSNDIAGFGGVIVTALLMAGTAQVTISGTGAVSRAPVVVASGKAGAIGSGAVTRTPVLAGTGTAGVVATTIALSAGNNQSAAVNTTVPVNPTVLVTGAGSVPAAGVLVTWTVTGGGGNVSPGTSLTNANGLASTAWTMGASAGANTMQASVSGLSGSPVSFAATATAASFDFFTDWRAGNTTDGGKLVLWGGGPAISVVSASGLGMPASMTNVLQVALGTGNFDWAQANNAWTVPAIGGWRYFRMYIRLVVGAVSGGFASTHPLESEGGSTSVSGAYYALHVGSNTDLSFPWMLDIGGFGGQWTTPNWTGGAPGTLTQSVTYRIEWGYLRTATSTYTIDMRIYGADDSTLLHDKNDLEWWGQSSGNMASGGGGQNIDTAHMEDLRFGINGGAIPSGNLYYGGFATRLGSAGDWCGPHTSNG